METIEHLVGRLEGKMDLMITNQASMNDCVKALHARVDRVEEDITVVRVDQKIFKRDIKWITAIGLGIIAVTKWIVSAIK